MASLYVPGGDPSRVYYGTDTRAQAMLIGAALAVIVTLHGPIRSRVGTRSSRSARRSASSSSSLPWFATNATRCARRLLRPVRSARVLGRDRGRDLASHATVTRRARPRAATAHRCVGSVTSPTRCTSGTGRCTSCSPPTARGLDGAAARGAAVGRRRALGDALLVARPIRRGVRLRSPHQARSVSSWSSSSVGRRRSPRPSAPAGAQRDVGQVADRPPPAPTPPLRSRCSWWAIRRRRRSRRAGGRRRSVRPVGPAGVRVWNQRFSVARSASARLRGHGEARTTSAGPMGLAAGWSSDVSAFRPMCGRVMAGAWDLFDAVVPRWFGGAPRQRATGRDVECWRLLDTLTATGAAVVAVRPPCFGESHLVGTDPQNAGGTTWSPRRSTPRGPATRRRRRPEMLDLNCVLCPGGQAGNHRLDLGPVPPARCRERPGQLAEVDDQDINHGREAGWSLSGWTSFNFREDATPKEQAATPAPPPPPPGGSVILGVLLTVFLLRPAWAAAHRTTTTAIREPFMPSPNKTSAQRHDRFERESGSLKNSSTSQIPTALTTSSSRPCSPSTR